jgi:prophage antirepressor-like protein
VIKCQEWLGGAEITPHMRNEDWLMGEVVRKLLTCGTMTAYNTNEIRRLNIVLLSNICKTNYHMSNDPKELHNLNCLSSSVLATRRHTFSRGNHSL